MFIFNFLKNILAIILIVGIVYFATNYSGAIKEKVGVKGASTKKVQAISGQLSKDIDSQIAPLKVWVLNIKVSDFVNGLSRAQKIPEDIKGSKDYLKDQMHNVLKSGQH